MEYFNHLQNKTELKSYNVPNRSPRTAPAEMFAMLTQSFCL